MNPTIQQKFRSIDRIVDTLLRQGIYREGHDRVKFDAKQVIQNIIHMNALQGTLTTNDGLDANLLKLEGLIPTEFRGHTYNTPIRLWIPSTYPEGKPIVYVTPIDNLRIVSQHDYVDTSGLVTTPYLSSWTPDESNLVVFITDLCTIFSKSPPLRSVPSKPPMRTSSQPSEPAHIPESQAPVPHPPVRGASMPSTSWHSMGDMFSEYGGSTPGATTPSSNHAHSGNMSGLQHVHSIESDSHTPPVSPSPITQEDNHQILERQTSEELRQGDHIRDKVTAMLQDEMHSLLLSYRDEIDRQNALKHKLREASDTLEQATEAYQEELKSLEEYRQLLVDRQASVQQWIEVAESRDIDDADLIQEVKPRDPLTAQLFDLVSEAAAIDDAFYWLGKAVDAGNISVEVFVEQVRTRARRQFYCKALAQKICDAMANDLASHTPQTSSTVISTERRMSELDGSYVHINRSTSGRLTFHSQQFAMAT